MALIVVDAITVAANAAAMGGAHRATAIGFVSAFSRLPVHPANTKANNRAMILIRAIPFCQVSKQERRREWNAIIGIGGWKYDPRENRESARSRLTSRCIRTRRPRVCRVCAGGFLPRRFVHVRFGHADGLRWWLGRGPTCVVRITLHVGPLLK